MNIKELRDCIHKSKLERDLLCELTPENQIFFARAKGTFEAISSGNGSEKYLIPEAGTLHFLFRGQNKEYIPCVPSLYRGNPKDVNIFIERMRLIVFKRLLYTHPVITDFFKKHNFFVDVEGLAQHYGLKTSVLDLSSSLDVALFFATCKYDPIEDKYSYYDDGMEHYGILYVFDPLFDNEPTPPVDFKNYMRGNIRPIGLQAFLRPGLQEGYALHIPRNQSTKSWLYKFSFSCSDSKYYFDKFSNGELLWIKDELVEKVKEIKCLKEFSYDIFNETFEQFRPKGFSRTALKKALLQLNPGVSLKVKLDTVSFSREEKLEIIHRWNNGLGESFCKTIVRKPWFNHDRINETTNKIEGIRNRNDFNNFDKLSELMQVKMCMTTNPPINSEWRNYLNTPRPLPKTDKTIVHKIEASFTNVLGQPWLKEEDWFIKI